MPVTATCTAYFGSDAGRGWSESHQLSISTPVGNLLPVLQNFRTLIDQFRKPLLARDRYLKGLKVSYPTETGDLASAPFRYQPRLYPGNQREGCAPSIAAMARLGTATAQQWSNCYLRGFWDVVEQDEELNFNTAGGGAWKALYDQYSAALVSGQYGFSALNDQTTARGACTGYTTDLNGFVTFTLVPDNPALIPAAGVKKEFRFARLNNSASPLNKSFVCEVIDGTHVKTVKRTAAGPFVDQGTFVMEQTIFQRYTGTVYVILARKPEGNPTLASRVRRKAQARF